MMVYFASFKNERTGQEFEDEMLCASCFSKLSQEDDWKKEGPSQAYTTAQDEELIGEPCYLCEEEFI